MERVENIEMLDNKVLLEENIKIPGRMWINTIGLVFLTIAFTIGRQHMVLYIIILLVTLMQIKFMWNYYQTRYRLTMEGLQIASGKRVLLNIPYQNILEIKEGHFGELVNDPEVKMLNEAKDIEAYPKLGGHKQLVLLLYKKGAHHKALFFVPSLKLRMFIADRLGEQES